MRLPSNVAGPRGQSVPCAIRYDFILTSHFLALFDDTFSTFPEPIIQHVVLEQPFIQHNHAIVLEIGVLEELHGHAVRNKQSLPKDQDREIAVIKNPLQRSRVCVNGGQVK